MTFGDAAGLMIGSGDSSDPVLPDSISYSDVDDYNAMLTEHYPDGHDRKIRVGLYNKGTVNEQVSSLSFLDSDGNVEKQISFSGFYVG